MPRPLSGPAIHAGQPPERAGTNCDGPEAAPAHSKKTHTTMLTSPSAPSARTTPKGARPPAEPPVSAGVLSASGAGDRGVVAACMEPFLPLAGPRVSPAGDNLHDRPCHSGAPVCARPRRIARSWAVAGRHLYAKF
jgi:hypothetical protein